MQFGVVAADSAQVFFVTTSAKWFNYVAVSVAEVPCSRWTLLLDTVRKVYWGNWPYIRPWARRLIDGYYTTLSFRDRKIRTFLRPCERRINT